MDHEEAGESSSRPNGNNGARQRRVQVGATRTTRQSQPRTDKSSATATTTVVTFAPSQSVRERRQRNDVPRRQAATEVVDDGLAEHGWSRVDHMTTIKDFFLVDNVEQLFQGQVTHTKPTGNGMDQLSRVVFDDGKVCIYSPYALSLCELFSNFEAGASRPKLNHGKVAYGCVKCHARFSLRKELAYHEWLVKACGVSPESIGIETLDKHGIDISLLDHPDVWQLYKGLSKRDRQRLEEESWEHYPAARCRETWPIVVERKAIPMRSEVLKFLAALEGEGRIRDPLLPNVDQLKYKSNQEVFTATKEKILKMVKGTDEWLAICYNFWMKGVFLVCMRVCIVRYNFFLTSLLLSQ